MVILKCMQILTCTWYLLVRFEEAVLESDSTYSDVLMARVDIPDTRALFLESETVQNIVKDVFSEYAHIQDRKEYDKPIARNEDEEEFAFMMDWCLLDWSCPTQFCWLFIG